MKLSVTIKNQYVITTAKTVFFVNYENILKHLIDFIFKKKKTIDSRMSKTCTGQIIALLISIKI